MRKSLILPLVGTVVVGLSYAQENRGHSEAFPDVTVTSRVSSVPEKFLYDDDGGRAQVVPRGFTDNWNMTYHGGPVVHHPLQDSVFLGSAWAEPGSRIRESELSELAEHTPDSARRRLVRFGVYTQVGRSRVHEDFTDEDFTDLDQIKTINDLQIQRHLARMLQSASLPAPSPSTIYVVYLPPGVQSTLGGINAGTEYVAYHNFFHSDEGLVRYAVMPFEADRQRARDLAWWAFAEAALDPTGQGWY